MSHPNVNLQDSFLNQVRKESEEVEVMLVSGATFRGVVRGFDNFTVMMHVDGKQHLVYKHAVAQMIAPKMQRPPRPAEDRERPSRPPRGKGKPRPGGEDASQGRKSAEKFNALDLSGVKLEKGEKPAPKAQAPKPEDRTAEAKPVEAKPAEAKPVEAEPVEAKPEAARPEAANVPEPSESPEAETPKPGEAKSE